MRKFRGKKAEAHYERNAMDGRTGRMHLDLDMRHIGTPDRLKFDLPALQVIVQDATLTPEDTAIIYNVLRKHIVGGNKVEEGPKTQTSRVATPS